MKTITKERIKNPFLFIAVLSLITVLIVSWLFGSEFLTVITYSEDYIKANGGMSKKEYLNMILPQILSWENSWMGAFTYLVNFFTLFPCLVVLEFSKELKGYFPHAVIYMKNGNMSIRKACIFYAILGGIVVSVSLLLGDIMLAPFAKAALTDIGGADDFFPKNFYVLHPFFVFNTLDKAILYCSSQLKFLSNLFQNAKLYSASFHISDNSNIFCSSVIFLLSFCSSAFSYLSTEFIHFSFLLVNGLLCLHLNQFKILTISCSN